MSRTVSGGGRVRRVAVPVALALAAASVGCAERAPQPRAELDRPNLVLLISDDQDWRELGFMGTPTVRTPNLDRLAREGTVFAQAHLPMSRCRPTLASFLSGQWPHRSGQYFAYGKGELRAPDALPALLRDAGYETFVGGKYWEGDPRRLGFTAGKGDGSNTFVRKGQNGAFAFLDRWAGRRPMFVWWAPKIPHLPHDPPAELKAIFRKADVPVPSWITPEHRDSYVKDQRLAWAMEAWLDEAEGELVDRLDALGQLGNTVFVFVIDNGWVNGLPSKGTPYENGVRTPVIVTWRGRLDGGRFLDGLTSTLDIYPTLLELAGVPVPSGADGRSWVPFLWPGAEAGAASPWRDTLCGATYPAFATKGDQRAERDVYALYTREGPWKYVLWLQDITEAENQNRLRIPEPDLDFPARPAGTEELYDLDDDPDELHDLAAEPEQAERVARMRGEALDWWKATGGKPFDGEPGETLRRMGLGAYSAASQSSG